MSSKTKEHAKDYLVDFSRDKCDWLKLLIYEAVNTNGKISDDRFNEIYSNLKDETRIQLPALNTQSTSNTQNISLKKLQHISGVNALASNQTINFCEDVTILWGLNGAGKSSYFRVLNEIVGGNEKKEILSNIHKDQSESIQVILFYNDGRENELTFDNSKRGFEALSMCKVFDSSYLRGLLSQRTQDETILEPLGLHLFKYIAHKIDEFKVRLNCDADALKNSKPTISKEDFSDQLKREFETHNLSESTIALVNEKYEFTDYHDRQLRDIKVELENLKQTNYADRIDLLKVENQEIRKIYDFLKEKTKLEAKAKEIQKMCLEKKKKEVANKETLEKIDILKNLPFAKSTEWKNFISAGAKLKEKNQTYSNCIYCNQPLQKDAIELVQAYAEYLGDESEDALKTAKSNLANAKRDIDALSVSLNIADNLKQKYKDFYLDNTDTLIITALDEAQKSIAEFKSYLLDLIDEKEHEKKSIEITPRLCFWLVDKFRENARTMRTLNADDTQKNQKMETLENKLKVLLENQSISKQKTAIEKWLEINQVEKALRKKEEEISTIAVTRLSNKAHDELLTSELNKAFKSELGHLGYKNLSVELVKATSGKGSNSTKLILKNNNSIQNILSEGEQKAIALALFVAEVAVQKLQSPIILDDPVNSLDHKIAANFANRLLSLDHQLIIFNHNRLFQDAFETAKTGHICKTINSSCNQQGKHILVYNVCSEGTSRKGVLSFYRNNTFKNHIEEAKKELQKSPFTEHSKVSALLRKSVECMIDETVLNGVIPTKYSNKNNRIHWDKLKSFKCSPEDIEKMRKVHDRVSAGDLHNGTESQNNSLSVEEFKEMITDLESIMSE